jgi:hypothetical protein
VKRLQPAIPESVDIYGANSVMSPTEGAPTPKGASQSTTIRFPIDPLAILGAFRINEQREILNTRHVCERLSTGWLGPS